MALTEPLYQGPMPAGNPVHDLLQRLSNAHDQLEEARRRENEAAVVADEAHKRRIEAEKGFQATGEEVQAMIAITLGSPPNSFKGNLDRPYGVPKALYDQAMVR